MKGGATAHAAVLAAVGIVLGLTYHRLYASGFLAAADATAGVDGNFRAHLLPHVTVHQAKEAFGVSAALVDARFAADYQADHVAGTINIPPKTDGETRARLLAGVPKDKTIIVFCKSSGCGFSYEVAKELLRDGFTDVRIFRGGWDEWVATYGKDKAR